MADLNERIMAALVAGRDEKQVAACAKVDAWLAEGTERPEFSGAIEDLAALSYENYVERCKPASRKLDVSLKKLDTVVARKRPRDEEDDEQGENLNIEEVKPWEAEVNGSALLNEIAIVLRRYIYFSNESDADTVALFILGSYCFNEFSKFPFLGISAAAENSGKTTLAKCVYRLAYKSIPMNNVTPAALFRMIAIHQGTLVIDEMDTFLTEESELYGILNSGHDKELAYVIRTVGEDHEPRRFSTWCPRVWAMIGMPKRTVISRSLVIRLLRKPKNMTMEELPNPEQMGDEWKRIQRQCARWAADHRKSLSETAASPNGLANREADNWAPLFLIANRAEWLERAKKAAELPAVHTAEALNISLLRDLRNIFHTRKVDQLPSLVLVTDLAMQSDAPWSKYVPANHSGTGDRITAYQLGELLGGLNIKSQVFRIKKDAKYDGNGLQPGRLVRGYCIKQLEELIESYLGDEKSEEVPIASYISF